MRKFFQVTSALFFLAAGQLFGSSVDEKAVTAAFESVEQAARDMIDTAFTPFTGYKKGELLAIGALGGLEVERIHETPDIDAEDFYGVAAGIGAGYALTDRLMAYGILTGVRLDGKTEGPFFQSPLEADFTFSGLGLFAGLGIEAVSTPRFSLPLYAGFNGCFYSGTLQTEEESLYTQTFSMKAESSGFLPGFSGGAAAQVTLGRFNGSLYYLYVRNFSGMKGDADVSASPIPTAGASFSADSYAGSTYGLSAGFSPSKKWSFGVKLVNLLPRLIEQDDDLRYRALIFTIRYRS